MGSSPHDHSRAGSLGVTIISATLFPRGGSESGPVDTYATVILGRQQFSTKVAKDHGSLPVWNEKLALDLDRNEIGAAEDLIVEIHAVNPGVPRLLAIARLPLLKVSEAREQTSLLPLFEPSEGLDCGQLKLTLNRVSSGKSQPAMDGANEGTNTSPAPSYPSPSTQKGFSLSPQMSSYPPSSPGDAAAHALSSLSLEKERNERYGRPGEGPPSSYPPLNPSSSPYPSQGLPYLASPIGGVVTGLPYSPPSPAYTHPPPYAYSPSGPYLSSYPPSAPDHLKLPENLDDVSIAKTKTEETSYPSQYYGGPPVPNSESYPQAPSEYPPKFSESNPGNQAYPNFSPYGPTAPSAPAVPYPQPERHDGQGKQKTKKEFDSPTSNYDVSPSFPGADQQPHSGYPPSGSYPPLSGPRDQGPVPVGYPPQQAGEQNHPPPAGYPGQNVRPGEQTSESTVSSSSEGAAEGTGEEKGFKHGQHGQHGQHGYGGYPQPGYGQPMYPQPGYGAYPSHGYAPSYPPAYPGHGYTPEAYPSYGHGVPGYVQPYAHGGHGVPHHAPAPYGAYGEAPYYGGHGDYKHHKGGHKGYKHKKMKKMKKGHYLHFEQPYGYYGEHSGGHYGGHHGGHGGHGGKHGHGKHKH